MGRLIYKGGISFGIKILIGSNIQEYYGPKEEMKKAYSHLLQNRNIKITSVSITRVEKNWSPIPVDHYMAMISYDQYKII